MSEKGTETPSTSNTESLPLVAVVYEGLNEEDPPMLHAEAAKGTCRLLWVLPHPDGVSRAARRFVSGLGDVVDAGASDIVEAAEAIRAYAPAGIVCFNDGNLAWAAAIAERLGLRFFSTATVAKLTDKLEQRQALREFGLPTPPFWDADSLSHDESLVAEVRATGLPVVLKPRHGRGARDTELIRSDSELRAALAAVVSGRMLVEGFIPDPSNSITGVGNAPFVSVELLASRGVVSILGVTGKTPLAPPFRETGHLFPADLSGEAAAAVIEAATSATHALDVEDGVLHVEVKCTDMGPVVIEVNGVMAGGAIRGLLMRALDVDLITLAMRVALGERVMYATLTHPVDVGFRFDIQPDPQLRRITAVEGLDSVAAIPGVDRLITGIGPGDEFSWRDGRHSFVAAILGVAPDHAAAHRIRDEFLSRVIVSGTRQDQTG